MWRDPTCACCGRWAAYLRDAGFSVTINESNDMAAVKRVHGVPEALQSCHTALIGRYVIEGHIPIADMQRLLAEAPEAIGLAVPGMPQSAPGMDNPGQPYKVILFGPGKQAIYARH